jgi:hypothetical protein
MFTAVKNRELRKDFFDKNSSTTENVDFIATEKQFIDLLNLENLDQEVTQSPQLVEGLEAAIAFAIPLAYGDASALGDEAAHRFLQRILYRINRLNLFWYDDLRHYKNERSFYLQWVRDRIESVWQDWELGQIDVASLKQQNVQQTLEVWYEEDLNPPITENRRFLREEMDYEGYRWLLAIASLTA